MTRVVHLAFLAIFFFSCGSQQQTGVSAAMNPLSAIKALMLVKDNIHYVTEQITGDAPANDKIDKASIQMLNKLNKADRDSTLFKEHLLNKVSKDVASKLTVLTQPLLHKMDLVNIQYKKFMQLIKNLEKYNNFTVNEFANVITSHSLSELDVVVEQMHTILTRNQIDGETILTLLSEGTDHKLMCGRNQSPQLVINELYKTIINLDLKSVAIRLLAFGIKERNNDSAFKFERKLLFRDYKRRARHSYEAVAGAMAKASRDLWRCDPPVSRDSKPFPNHQKGVTYSTLDAMFQYHLIFERDMDDTCYDQCGQYENKRNKCKSDYCRNEKRNCKNGTILSCQDMSDRVQYCPSPSDSERAYEWVKTDKDLIFGRDPNSCTNKIRERTYEYPEAGAAAPGPLSPLKHCNWCLCSCVDDQVKEKPRYFSLRNVLANDYDGNGQTDQNRVITGLKLILSKNIYQINVQTATLGPNATIVDTPTWKLPYDDSSLLKYTVSKNDPDLFQITRDNRKVYLHEFDGKELDKVLVGVRFVRVRDGGGLAFHVALAKFDYATGQLGPSQWYFGRAKDSQVETSLKNADDPLRHFNDAEYSKPNTFVQFQTTSLEKDVGQLTVPFIDTQEVVSHPPVPFYGAGLFVKGTEGSGGLLALKLIQYDYSIAR